MPRVDRTNKTVAGLDVHKASIIFADNCTTFVNNQYLYMKYQVELVDMKCIRSFFAAHH